MTLTTTPQCDFDDVPISPVDGGTNLLVSGPESAGLSKLVDRLLAVGDDEAAVVVSPTEDAGSCFRNYRRVAGRGVGDRTGIVDCCGSPGDSRQATVRAVDGPADLTAIGMEFSALYDEFSYADIDRVRSGLHSIIPLCASTEDMRDVYRFVQNTTARVRRTDGLGVCAIDPTAESGQAQSGASITTGVSRAFDGHVELRAEGRDTEIRVTDLDGHDDDWRSVSL